MKIFKLIELNLSKILATVLLWSSFGAGAYQLGNTNECKEKVQNWILVEGKCDSNGLLQGAGVVHKSNLLVWGQMKDGVPNGKSDFLFLHPPETRQNGTDHIRKSKYLYENKRGTCRTTFSNGQITGDELECNRLSAKLKSDTFKIVDTKFKVWAGSQGDQFYDALAIEAFNIQVVAKNQRVSGLPPDGTGSNYDLNGTAQKIVVQFISGGSAPQSILLSDIDASLSRSDKNGATGLLEIKGQFKSIKEASYSGLNIELNSIDVDGQPSKFPDSKFIYSFKTTLDEFSGAVLDPNIQREFEQSRHLFTYYKSKDGLEFNASGFELCLNLHQRRRKESGYMLVTEGRKPNENRFAPTVIERVLKPRCGKIIDKTGRSFAGFFDENGRPLPN